MVSQQLDVSTSARPEWSLPLDDPLAGTWFVAATRINMERRAAQDFVARGVDYFLPLIDRVQISAGTRRVVPTPAFSRYIFIRGNELTPSDALAGRKLMNVMPVANQALLRRELRAVELAIEMNPRANVCPYAIKGKHCRITSGSLIGREGIVLDRKERTDRVTVILQVTMLGQSIEAEVDVSQLEPCE